MEAPQGRPDAGFHAESLAVPPAARQFADLAIRRIV